MYTFDHSRICAARRTLALLEEAYDPIWDTAMFAGEKFDIPDFDRLALSALESALASASVAHAAAVMAYKAVVDATYEGDRPNPPAGHREIAMVEELLRTAMITKELAFEAHAAFKNNNDLPEADAEADDEDDHHLIHRDDCVTEWGATERDPS